jgi:hypothetical protein
LLLFSCYLLSLRELLLPSYTHYFQTCISVHIPLQNLPDLFISSALEIFSRHFTLNMTQIKLCPPSSALKELYHKSFNGQNQATTHPLPPSPSPNPSNKQSVNLSCKYLLKDFSSLYWFRGYHLSLT